VGIPERFAGRPPLPPDLPDRLRELPAALEAAGVELAYLFGSVLSSRAPHDVDLAVLAADADAAALRAAGVLGTDRLDVVDLARAPDSLLLHVLRTGRRIHRRSVQVENAFESRALRRIQDHEPWRRRQDQILRRRLGA
jgi:predicted nucleotidyltransferase